MSLYEYKAIDGRGKAVAGIIDADTARHARQKLRGQNIFPTEIAEGSGSAVSFASKDIGLFFRKVSLKELALMTRQFSTLIKAGLPIMEALTALTEQLENKYFKKVVAQVREDVKEGKSLASAMEKFPDVFSNLYRNLTLAGEKSGTLDLMLGRMADNLEYQIEQTNRIYSILYYPIGMLITGTAIVSFLLISVVPKITSVFEGMEKALPLPTVILLALSGFLRSYWWVILIVIISGWIWFKRYGKTPAGRSNLDLWYLSIPYYGEITKMMAVSKLTRTLATLLSSGIPLLDAITVAKKVTGNSRIEDVLDRVAENIREGESISEPIKRNKLFPPLVMHMIAIGEKSGELETMLVKVADIYDSEVSNVIKKFTAILPMVLTLLMGLVVFGIVMAVLLPIFEMSSGF